MPATTAPPTFDALQSLAELEALGVVVSASGFSFPDGCTAQMFDALTALGTTPNALQVMALADARR